MFHRRVEARGSCNLQAWRGAPLPRSVNAAPSCISSAVLVVLPGSPAMAPARPAAQTYHLCKADGPRDEDVARSHRATMRGTCGAPLRQVIGHRRSPRGGERAGGRVWAILAPEFQDLDSAANQIVAARTFPGRSQVRFLWQARA